MQGTQVLFGVVDDARELFLVLVGDLIAKNEIDLGSNDAGRISQNVKKGIRLAVEIAQKMLGSLGEI